VSVRRDGASQLGIKVELKNLNSFKHLERALAYESERQIETREEGGEGVQETRLWDEGLEETRPMRSKEYASDYRYFPDPDLIPLRLEDDWIRALRKDLPELPHERRERFERDLGLGADDAQVLSEDRKIADFFEETVRLHADARTVANWVIRSVRPAAAEHAEGLAGLRLTAHRLAELLDMVGRGEITQGSAREVFAEMATSGRSPAEVVRERGLQAVADAGELEAIATEVLAAHPGQVEQYRGGDEKVLNFFIGQLMKRTRGKANPAVARQVLSRLLSA
jgi:aspartyl-tRNA(Asn)/glutamyl-tRNA(Gln) amidotransferase subunit B